MRQCDASSTASSAKSSERNSRSEFDRQLPRPLRTKWTRSPGKMDTHLGFAESLLVRGIHHYLHASQSALFHLTIRPHLPQIRPYLPQIRPYLPQGSTVETNPQQPEEQGGTISTLDAVFEASKLAKEVSIITPAFSSHDQGLSPSHPLLVCRGLRWF